MRSICVFALVVAAAARDVPLGECHECEVTCFDDCAGKYNAEIIQAERREYEHKQRMLRENGGGHISKRGLAGVRLESLAQAATRQADANSTEARSHVFAWRALKNTKAQKAQQLQQTNRFIGCLRREKCIGHPLKNTVPLRPRAPECADFTRPPALLALRGQNGNRCAVGGDQACALKCAEESAAVPESATALVERTSQKDFPLRPVRIGSFAKHGMTLDFCFKSCLAVTCGCSDAPGFESISKLSRQIKNNEGAGEPVDDTKPSYQYKPASLAECGKGMYGKKVNQQLYVNTGTGAGDGGWTEICTTEMITSIFGSGFADQGEFVEKCNSQLPEDTSYGCSWNNEKQKCLVGFIPVSVECNVRFLRDPTF